MGLKKLKWAETPFDRMSHEELLLNAKRLYSALSDCQYPLSSFLNSPLVGPTYIGHDSKKRAEIALRTVEKGFDKESIYRMFFRYSDDLLFSPKLGCDWGVCESCDHFLGDFSKNKECMVCKKTMRQFRWSDLAMKKQNNRNVQGDS